ncbi:MAG: adenylate/guanylate cyclase domain-containing protein [Betaproteobacteria bacterium]
MICASCGYEAPADFAFCPKCGSRLAGTSTPRPELPPAQARSPAPATTPPGEAEADRRPVTVLFADLSGFTALSERLDPEDVRALQTDLFKEMSGAIARFDGFVEKFVGDAVMGVFGAPVAHEDDPERALRAALSMLERIAVLSKRWAHRVGTPLDLHIGVNTGPVVAGNIGSDPGAAYAVTGDAVNTASRLQSKAGPAQIFVSQSTYLLTRHAFNFESLGEVPLKGKAGPVPVYRVDAALSAPGSAHGLELHGLGARLIGRGHELRELLAAFERMLTGHTEVVSVIGDAGAGKTRLQAEFLAHLEEAGHLRKAVVRRAVCSPLGERAYGVPAALLRDAYGVVPGDTPAEVRKKLVAGLKAIGADEMETDRLAAFLGYVLGFETEDSRTRHLEPEQVGRQIFLAAQAVIEHRLKHSALVLAVEDLHWADAASVELLRFLVDRLQERRFMLVISHRPTPEVAQVAPPGAAHTVLRLESLSANDSEMLLGALFGTSSLRLPDALRLRILERAGGNPLFLEEMVRSLIAGGVLAQENGEWVCRASADSVNVPLTIHGLLLARIDALPAHARQAIQEAAVVGPEFSNALLREVAAEPDSLDQALDMLVNAELLVDPSRTAGATEKPSQSQGPAAKAAGAPRPATTGSGTERQFRFCHGLLHEVAYQNLLVRRRTELHTRIGEALERIFGAQPQRIEDLESLAHHFRLSADKLRGARYLVAAGDRARAIYANADAIRHFRDALETLEACNDCAADRLAVNERLGDLLGPAGERAAAMLHFAAVRDGYASAADRPAQARVLRKIGRLHWDAGDRAEAAHCFEQGLALIDGESDHIERAQLYREMGRLAFRSGDNQGAARWAEQALTEAERLAASATTDEERRATAEAIALALNTLGAAFARLNRPKDAVTYLERSVETARAADLLQIECRSLANLGVLYSTVEPARAIKTGQRGLETAKRIGDFGLQSRLHTTLAVAYCALTNRCDEQGVEAAQAAIELDRRLGQLDHLTVPLIVLGQIFQCHGDPSRALGYYQEAVVLAERAGEPQLLFPCYDGLATLYLDMDDSSRAEHYMLKAQEVCERAGLEPDDLTVLPFLL